MRITKLLREAQKQSSCNSNSLNEAYKKILNGFSQDHFPFYLNEELKEVRAQLHFKHGVEELAALEQIVADLSKLTTLLENSQIRNKYGDLTYFKKELSKNLADYTLLYQGARKKAEVSKSSSPHKPKSIEEVVKAAIFLCDSLEKEKYVENVLSILAIKLANTREGLKVFNEEYADKMREKKYEVRKDSFLPRIDSWADFIRGSDFDATSINFSLDFRDRKTTNLGVIAGSYRVQAVMRKRIQNDVSYSAQDILRFESEISSLKNLERTDYAALKAENKGKFERLRNGEFVNELDKVLHVLSTSFELRLPRQTVSKLLSQNTKMLYDEVINPDTDYFKLKGENYSLYVGVKAKGKSTDHNVCVSLEYKKI